MRPTAVSFVKMPRFSFATRNSKLIRKRLRDFVSGLRISHRLMLIYFLSIIPVLILSYGLVIEKSKTIEFARKEQRGSSYAAIARDTLLALVEGKRATVLSATELPEATGRNSLTDEASALEAGESQLGKGMNTAALVEELARELRSLDENATQSPAERRALQDQAITTTLVLISRIGEQSNLVLDPDLGSYFLMSMVVLRLPLVTTIAIDLAEMVKTLGPDAKDPDELRAQLLVTEGVFKAATTGFASDGAAALRGIGSLSEESTLQSGIDAATTAIEQYSTLLAELSATRAGGMGASALLEAKLAQLLSTTRDVWLTANRELDQLLQARVDDVYRQIMFDLGTAALLWLLALALILLIARQITGPLSELAAVTERVRFGDDDMARAERPAGGEIGTLVRGFNAMLDYLQRETQREQERIARDRAAAAQQQLLEAMPSIISVVSDFDGSILYSNIDAAHPLWSSVFAEDNPHGALGLLTPASRSAFLGILQQFGRVDAFEACCENAEDEPFWMLIAARRVDYQGEPARLEVYTPITDRKRTEAALSRRNAVLDAVTYAARRIIGTTDWRLAMPELLARLGVATQVSRAFLFEIQPAQGGTGMAQSCQFLWSAPGIQRLSDDHPRLRNVPIPTAQDSQLGDLLARRSQGEVIQITRTQTRGDARKLFDETETLSLLSVPIMVDGMIWGALGFDDCCRERVWDKMEIELLKSATALIAEAIERARAEGRLRERDSQLVEAQRIASVGSWVLDLETDHVSWSDEGLRIFGLSPGGGAWTQQENLQYIHPDDRRRVAEADATARLTGQQFEIEYRIIRPDGEIRTVFERTEPAFDEHGEPLRLIGTVRDVTELRTAEARLRESEERYALAAKGAGVGLWDWDISTDKAYFSPRLHEILGASSGGLGSSIAGLFDRLVPADRDGLRRHLDGRFARQRPKFQYELRAMHCCGGVRWLLVRGLILYAEGRPHRLVGSIGDITEHKRVQEEVIRQREALYRNEKLAVMGSLLAGVAHELNNPLSVIIGQLVLLQETTADQAVVSRAGRIQTAAERCARIVRSFLAMARQRPPERVPIALNAVIETAVELLSFQLRAADIRIELDFDPKLADVVADADQLHQVLINLIDNARQALLNIASSRSIRIGTRADLQEGKAELTVSDNGPGIPANIRNRIFEPFFTTKPLGEGTGVGLSLCSSIIRSHGGEIAVSDRQGGGTTFTIKLPLPDFAHVPRADKQQGGTLRRLHVLIVDDEPEIVDTLREILAGQGHVVDTAADGQRGLERALNSDYNVILSDIRMPHLDGIGFYHALQRKRPDMIDRLAFITGDTLGAEIQSFIAETGSPCLEKPFLPDDVLRFLSEIERLRAAG